MRESDWRWLLDVNLMGAVYTAEAFAPGLIAQKGGHILFTASVGGFLASDVTGVYSTTKYALVGYGEALRMELERHGVGVTLLCPGSTDTRLVDSNRLRPADWGAGAGDSQTLRPLLQWGLQDADAVAAASLQGLRANAPYVFTHPEYRDLIRQRFETILKGFGERGGS